MVINRARGSNQPSTSETKKRKKDRKRKRFEENDRSIAKKAEVLELRTQLHLRDQELRALTERLAKALNDLKQLSASGLGPREKVRLNSLFHFHTRVLNSQMVCKEDKKIINTLLEDVKHVLKRDLQPYT